jgi:electron transfer flavoprotein alpha subunit
MTNILVIAELRQGTIRPISSQLVTAAQSLRTGPQDSVTVVILDPNPDAFVDTLSLRGVDEILKVKTPQEFDPEIWATSVDSIVRARTARSVLVGHTVDSCGFAAALAIKSGFGFASDLIKVEHFDGELVATRSAYVEKIYVELCFPQKYSVVLCVRENVYRPADGPAEPSVSAWEAPSIVSRITSKRFIEPPPSEGTDLSAAEFIVAIGRGIGDQANVEPFEELAESMGAVLGCSRPLADAGWLPKSRQVGQSGKTASACRLYLAMGISGASQHLAGMKHIPTIIAVNSDPRASIYSVAKYGVVGDVLELRKELAREFG